MTQPTTRPFRLTITSPRPGSGVCSSSSRKRTRRALRASFMRHIGALPMKKGLASLT